MVVAAIVVVLPLAAFYARYPDEFTAPMQRVSLLGGWLEREVAATGMPAWRILATRIGISALVFSSYSLTLEKPAFAVTLLAGVAGIAAEYGNAFDDMRSGDVIRSVILL